MLILTRRPFEAVYIGDDTRIRVLGFRWDCAVRLKIEAPALSAPARAVAGIEPGWRLSLLEGESVSIGPSRVMVQATRGTAVRLGIDAPPDRKVLRGELFMENAPSMTFEGRDGGEREVTVTLTRRDEKRASLLVTAPLYWAPPPDMLGRIEEWTSEQLGKAFEYAGALDSSRSPRGELATKAGGSAELWLMTAKTPVQAKDER